MLTVETKRLIMLPPSEPIEYDDPRVHIDAERETWRRLLQVDRPLALESGKTLDSFTVAYETYGTLNTDRSNAILICHALSGDAHVAGHYDDAPSDAPGWWDEAVGPGKMFDTRRFFVICTNVLGGCQGSSGPSSLAPDGQPYALRFPIVTIGDMVNAQRYLIDALGIARLYAVAGGSMGGMQALQWAIEYPDRVGSVLFLASTPRSSVQTIAFNETGRQAIYADPHWNHGDYYGHTLPTSGLAVARMVAHITYMSEQSLENKFGRTLQDTFSDNGGNTEFDERPHYTFGTEFSVESYLKYQGDKFVNRFDANSYLYMTKALDYFDVSRRYGSLTDALRRTRASFLVITFSSDWLYPAEQSAPLVETLQSLGRAVDYHHAQSWFGHDSFLVEVDLMTQLVGEFLN